MPSGQPKALVPQDLQGVRQNQIQLLQYLLGFGGAPGSGASPRGAPGPWGQGPSGPNAYIGTAGANDPLGRLQSFFGQLGMPQSGLQRQGADALGSMLNGPTPEQRALDISLPQLQSMLTGTGPQFERDLALGNQQGGRFGSANAILRGEAFKNLYNLRNQTAGTLGMLSQAAGGANRGLAEQAFGVGQQQAQQGDIETQRRLQLLMQLLGIGQGASFNVPTQPGKGPLDWLGQIAGIASAFIPGSAGVTGGGDGPIKSGSGSLP